MALVDATSERPRFAAISPPRGVVAWIPHRKLRYIKKMHIDLGRIWSFYGNMETKKSRIFDASSTEASSQVIEKQNRLSMQQRAPRPSPGGHEKELFVVDRGRRNGRAFVGSITTEAAADGFGSSAATNSLCGPGRLHAVAAALSNHPSGLPRHHGCSRLMWFLADVIGPLSVNVVPFSNNVVPGARIFSVNLIRKCGCNRFLRFMLSGRYKYPLFIGGIACIAQPIALILGARDFSPGHDVTPRCLRKHERIEAAGITQQFFWSARAFGPTH
jgi:hypothetical protein